MSVDLTYLERRYAEYARDWGNDCSCCSWSHHVPELLKEVRQLRKVRDAALVFIKRFETAADEEDLSYEIDNLIEALGGCDG